MPLSRRAAPRAEIMIWDGSKWQRALAESASYPNLRVSLYESGGRAAVTSPSADGRSQAIMGLWQLAMKHGFNESTWDRWRNNTEVTVLPSAARTAHGNSATQTNYNAKGVIVFIDITAVSGSFAAGEGLTIMVRGIDPVSGRLVYLGTSGPWTLPGTRLLIVYPGATNVQGIGAVTTNDIPLSRSWHVRYEITGTTPSFTFSVGTSYIV